MAPVTMPSPLGGESSTSSIVGVRYLRRGGLCHRFLCAARPWNFFAVAVLHDPTESPWRWCALHALRLILTVTCLVARDFARA
jgi:hypothetical protein